MAAVVIPDIFGSWLQGRRQAEADNWRDLAQYNQILKGQLDNAKEMATFDPNVRKTWIGADKDMVEAMKSAAQTENELLGLDSAIANDLPSLRGQTARMKYGETLNYTPKRNALDWDVTQYNDERNRRENERIDTYNRQADPVRLESLKQQLKVLQKQIEILESGGSLAAAGIHEPPAATLNPESPYTEAQQKQAEEEAEKRKKDLDARLSDNATMGY